LFASGAKLIFVPERWCTVTVADKEGRHHSLDLQADSLFDAAHIYVCHVKEHPERGLPQPTIATQFEVVIDGKVYRVDGKALQRWIVRQRGELKGPRGFLFSQRPMLE
jgi:hypothetical protein